MRASTLVEQQQHPLAWKFLDEEVEMQVNEVRTMLQLPQKNEPQQAGCNYATAAVLLNLLSGISVCLYNASLDNFQRRDDRSTRFKGLLEQYYPWNTARFSKKEASRIMWEVFRNPLAHSFGMDGRSGYKFIGYSKSPLSKEHISNIEQSARVPNILTMMGHERTLFQPSADWFGSQGIPPERRDGWIFLSVPCLYWGVWRLLECLCKDPQQMAMAEGFFTQLSNIS